MPASILQLNFKLNVSAAEYERAVAPLAPAFAEVPGLKWKLWFLDAEAGEAGGLYLFEDEDARQAFLDSDLAAQVKAAPFLRELSAKPFDTMETLSRVTRAPIQAAAPAAP